MEGPYYRLSLSSWLTVKTATKTALSMKIKSLLACSFHY